MSDAPIALVAPNYAPVIGGVERHVEAIARGLVARGLPVEVLTTDRTGSLPSTEVRDGVLVRRFPTLGRQPAYYVSPGLGRWLAARAGAYRLIHAHSYHALPALQAAAASRLRGVPLVLTPHYHGTGHTALRSLLHLPYRLAGGPMVRHARALICVSRVERELVRAHFGPALAAAVIPNAAEVEPIRAAEPWPRPAGERLIVCAGRLEGYKGIDGLIGALAHLPERYSLAVIGDGPAREGLARLIAARGLAGRVQLTGRVSTEELYRWYRAAAVVASLSRHEAFGMTILEGLAAGAAVVASDIPAHREVRTITGGGGAMALVPPLIAAPELAAAIAALGPGVAPATLPTWGAAVAEHIRIYEGLAGFAAAGRRPAGAAAESS